MKPTFGLVWVKTIPLWDNKSKFVTNIRIILIRRTRFTNNLRYKLVLALLLRSNFFQDAMR